MPGSVVQAGERDVGAVDLVAGGAELLADRAEVGARLMQYCIFTRGIRRDQAVVNGLTMAHSSGTVEGNVCRVKALKGQMFGRANLDLLRKRILFSR